MKKSATARAFFALCRVVVVGDTCVSEEGMAAIVARNERYHVYGHAHGFYDACELIRKRQPYVLLIEFAMPLPGFTADAPLHKKSGQYLMDGV
ncbi:MAG: hypothetical protein DMF40_08500 [Verrucomicrobia bacterium]|nr:MAG: hypothetical protein DMF40_08500 [Verrucomicrobiota bacterium]